MVGNIVDNAVVHNTDGGWIRIAGRRARRRGRGSSWRPAGAVLDQRDVDRLAQPFERLGADRTGSETGSGLGLSIVARSPPRTAAGSSLLARPTAACAADRGRQPVADGPAA